MMDYFSTKSAKTTESAPLLEIPIGQGDVRLREKG
jgi:hypothetical protein